MRPLVTGATTPLGGSVIRILLGDPEVDHLVATGIERDPPAGALPSSPRLTYQRADLTRARTAHDLLFGVARQRGVDTVIHLAIHRSPHGSRASRRLDVEATRELLLLAESLPSIERFIFRSAADVYAVRHATPDLLDEDQPLELDRRAPASVRDHVEADLTACARMGIGRLAITVLRLAEVLAPAQGSQLWDYLQSRVCLRPLGFDPMVNVLSLDDAAAAVRLALHAREGGVCNIPGADTLPLSRIAARWGRVDLPVPGPLLDPLYRLRTRVIGLDFRYDVNTRRFHFGGMLDGRRACERLGYQPAHPIDWPVAASPVPHHSQPRHEPGVGR